MRRGGRKPSREGPRPGRCGRLAGVKKVVVTLAFASLFSGCDSKKKAPDPAPASPPSARPASSVLRVPDDVTEPRPFVLLLHGLGGSGEEMVKGLGIEQLARQRHFSYAAPNGDFDRKGRRFWNAWRGCCDFDQTQPDHVARLRTMIEEAVKDPRVDAKRVWVLGFSNGGFMAHRLACEVSGIAAIVSISGAGPSDSERCAPPAPVAVYEIHGNRDSLVPFLGEHEFGQADAVRTVTRWASLDKSCEKKPHDLGQRDLVPSLPGAETKREAFRGCRRPIELWTVQGGTHTSALTAEMLRAVFDELEKAPPASLGGGSGR